MMIQRCFEQKVQEDRNMKEIFTQLVICAPLKLEQVSVKIDPIHCQIFILGHECSQTVCDMVESEYWWN